MQKSFLPSSVPPLAARGNFFKNPDPDTILQQARDKIKKNTYGKGRKHETDNSLFNVFFGWFSAFRVRGAGG
ncbi:MAG: hypothetical protein II771_02955, partial [Clostridia bacterium]|nr:hypothetical protein [Clostridia bacterium]